VRTQLRVISALFFLALYCAGQESSRPRHNASYVPDDDETARGLMAQAEQAAEAGDAATAAERLQALLLAENGGVLPLKGRELFVSARRWPRLMLLAERAPFGRNVLSAWRKAHDAEANGAIEGALISHDPDAILNLLDRYPGATLAPAALLALCDSALQRGDPDAARGHLLRLPEHVARSDEEAWLASKAYRSRWDHLEALEARGPSHWPTLGGDRMRSRNGDPLPPPGELTLLWDTPILEDVPNTFVIDSENRGRKHSPVLPFYPVCDEARLYVHVGGRVAVLDRKSGKLLYFAPDGNLPGLTRLDDMLQSSPGVRAATVHRGVLYFNRLLYRRTQSVESHNALIAFDVESRQVLWEVRPETAPRASILRRPVFFRGAPALRQGRLYVYGALRETSDDEPTRKEEAHLFCFDARSGNLIWSRFLGYGDTEAAPQLPPQSGLAPAVGAGVVIAVSGLGVAGALDARTGEVLWILRYDRKPARERARLTEWTEERVHLRSGWLREPPRIVGSRLFMAPFDSDEMYACWLRGRRDPATGSYDLVQWSKGRTKHLNSLLEYVAGMIGGRVYYVGRRDENHAPEAYQTVVSNPFGSEFGLAYGRIPPTERLEGATIAVPPELFGRPVIAGTVLCVPTRFALHRFDLGPEPAGEFKEGERFREIPLLPPFIPPAREPPEGERPVPLFGSLVALSGRLYAVSADRVLCYGPKKK
jgi:hypothetical protein